MGLAPSSHEESKQWRKMVHEEENENPSKP